MADYQSPNGSPIIGTSDIIPATALISGIDERGLPIYAGGSDVHWDCQETQTRNDKFVFVDEDGNTWTFDQLIKIEQST